MLGLLTGVAGTRDGEATRKRKRTTSRQLTIRTKRQVTASVKKCRQAGAPCEGHQADRCCAGLACAESARGSARRCTPCAAEGASCASDEACCGGACCRTEISPDGVCCASRESCCGSQCCPAGQACAQRELQCVVCTKEGEVCQNRVPFCTCCPGLDLVCDGLRCTCVPA